MTVSVAATVAAVALALVHVLGGRLDLPLVPRSSVLSAASGVSVSYVFVHLLPEVGELGGALDATGPLGTVHRWEWLLALAGVLVFHAVELWARRRRGGEGAATLDAWAHLGVYAAYTGLIGYLLLDQAVIEDSSLLLFTIAMALHLLVNDHGLRAHHGQFYEHVGRWVLAAAVVGGHVASLVVRLSEPQLAAPLAFLAGAIVLTVLKEELPEDRRSRITPLLVGAVLYSLLLLAV